MQFLQYQYEPKARISLTEDEIEQLIKVAVKHYDYKCKATVTGVLNKLKNMVWKGIAVDTLTFTELDTLAKIAEYGQNYMKKECPLAAACYEPMCETLQGLNEEHRKLNPR